MDIETAKNEARITCKNFLEDGSAIQLIAFNLTKDYEWFSGANHALLKQKEASFFAIKVMHDKNSSDEWERFRESFDRHYCRKVEFTDHVDNFSISTSISFGTTARFAA